MVRPLRLAVLSLAVALVLPLAARADPLQYPPLPPSEAYGFSAGQKGLNFGIPSGGGPTIGASFVLSPKAALELNLGLGFTFTGNSDYAFSVEMGYRAYLGHVGERLYPFVQPGFFFNRVDSAENIAVEGLIGVEYFLLEHFTISGATGLAFNIGNIGGSGDATVKLATGTTALFANFYF